MVEVRLLIEGIGSIGGVMAAKLIRAGYNPALVTGNTQITEAINENGIRVKTPEESFSVPARAFTQLKDVPVSPGGFHAAYLVMKAHSVVDAARRTMPLLNADSGFLLTCQNGIVQDSVASAVGKENVVSAVIGWGGNFDAPGVYEKTGPGSIILGELHGTLTERARGTAAILQNVSPVRISTNIYGAQWSKLAINCTITTLGALTGKTLGEMLRSREARKVFLIMYREVVDTAERIGIQLEPVAANPRLLYLPDHAGWSTALLKDLLTRVVGFKYRHVRSSSLQSLERGRKTEIEYLNGYVVGKAKEVGLEVPLNAEVVKLIKEIEEGKRKICEENMDEMSRAARAKTPDRGPRCNSGNR